MTVAERVDMLYAVADGINARFDEFLAAECADTGKPMSLASHIDIPRGAANFKIFADVIKNVPTEFFEMATPDGRGALNYAQRRPVGVVGVICPWNLPLLLMTWKVGPALACGNTVVVKPSEETPQTATLLGEVMNAVGVPKGIQRGAWLRTRLGRRVRHHPPQVNAITFTGETRTGTAIMKAAANGARPVSLEMGGKNPAIVFADCDFEAAIEGTMRSVFANCGQVCLGTERVYVERPIFDRFVAALKKGAEGMKLGRPEDPETALGPLISQEHKHKVLSYYAKARELGATVVTGGGVPEMPGALAEGAWVEPTIWTGLDDSSPIAREEVFGPCTLIQPFDSEDEVVRRANDTEYGLACSVGPATWPAPTAWRDASRRVWCGSIAGSCATCARPSAAPSSPASAARVGCIRSSSTPNSRTSASSCERRDERRQPGDRPPHPCRRNRDQLPRSG